MITNDFKRAVVCLFLCFLFWNDLFISFTIFLYCSWVFFLFLQSISSINPLSILDITNIFSFSVHYLLTIFMMSFVRKTSLILMYSNHPFLLICRPLLSSIKSLSSLVYSIGPFISIKLFSLLWLWNVSYYVIGQVPLPYHSFSMLIQLPIDFYYSKSILK